MISNKQLLVKEVDFEKGDNGDFVDKKCSVFGCPSELVTRFVMYFLKNKQKKPLLSAQKVQLSVCTILL